MLATTLLGRDAGDLTAYFGPGVYVLGDRDVVVYAGKAKRLITRLYTHRAVLERYRRTGQKKDFLTRVIPFTQAVGCPCREDELDKLERELIALYRPKYNTNLVPKISLAQSGFDISKIKITFGSLVNPTGLRRLCAAAAPEQPRLRRL